MLVATESKHTPKSRVCFAGKAVLRAVIAITPGKPSPRHGRGDNGLSVVSILEKPGTPWQAVISACCWAAWPIPPCTRKTKHKEEAAKKT